MSNIVRIDKIRYRIETEFHRIESNPIESDKIPSNHSGVHLFVVFEAGVLKKRYYGGRRMI